MHLLFKLLVYLAVPAAAFITFLIQPIVGKLLMPRYGGTAGTWMTISFFFQGSLLAGYTLAYLLSGRWRRPSLIVLAVLALTAPLLIKLPPWSFAGWPEWPAIVASLTVSLLPALLLTTSIGIVVQGWIHNRDGRVPFFLYGISNLGSTAALLAYPFLIEPHFGLSLQIIAIKGLLWLLGALVLALCWIERRRPTAGSPSPATAKETDAQETIPPGRILTWLLLAFSTCTLMLGSCHILSAEFGSNPYSWLVPLSIYLLSFTLTFTGWWGPVLTHACLVALGAAVFGYMHTKGVLQTSLSFWPLTWLVLTLLAGCMTGHALVYQLRPARRFTLFYLMLALAGLLAGLFASVGAPHLFNRNYEFAGAGIFLLVFCGLRLLPLPSPIARISLAALLFVPPGWFVFVQLRPDQNATARTTYLRNHYGNLVIHESESAISVSNETTLHGVQLTPAELRRTPTTYYAEGAAAGIVLRALQNERPSITIGAIGLGTGTLAAYARPPDHIVFWDINPLSLKVARERLTFLDDCVGKLAVRLMDGRLGIKAAPERFDVIIVDAFSGDSIPMHLLTREAMQDYIARLNQGILLVHISNRHVDLFPVVAAGARHAGWRAVTLTSTPNQINETARISTSVYVIVYPPQKEQAVTGWVEAAGRRTDYDYQLTYEPVRHIEWTDDRHAIVEVLRD